MKRHILLVGTPGCGKTTVIRRTVEILLARGVRIYGFWTGEVRDDSRQRVGFDIESVAGVRAVMAHVDFARGPAVSRYRVDIEAIDRVAVAEMRRALREGGPAATLIIDEMGKMEMFSSAFRDAVAAAMDGPLRVLATAMAKPHPFVDGVKGRSDVEVVSVTHANRDALPEVLAEELTAASR
jgi:nucleoside-triphosphatase